MNNKKSLLFRVLFILLIFSIAVLILNSAPQISQEKTSQNQKLIKPTPKNIKESTAFYVYIFWMWVVILILIYVLILKIKEADRIHKMGFEKSKKES